MRKVIVTSTDAAQMGGHYEHLCAYRIVLTSSNISWHIGPYTPNNIWL